MEHKIEGDDYRRNRIVIGTEEEPRSECTLISRCSGAERGSKKLRQQTERYVILVAQGFSLVRRTSREKSILKDGADAREIIISIEEPCRKPTQIRRSSGAESASKESQQFTKEESASKVHTAQSGMAELVHVANQVVASVGVIECIPEAESALVEHADKLQLARIQHAENRPICGPGLSTSAVIRRPSQQNKATAARPQAKQRQTATVFARKSAVVSQPPIKAWITPTSAARPALVASTTARPRDQTAPARQAPGKLVAPRPRDRTGPAPAAAPWPTAKPSVTAHLGAQTAPDSRPATKPSVASRPVQAPVVARPTPKASQLVLKSTTPALRPRAQTLPIPALATGLHPRSQAVPAPAPATAGQSRAYRPSGPTPSNPVAAVGPAKATTVSPRSRSYRAQALVAAGSGRPTTASPRSVSSSSTSSSRRMLRF